MQILREIASAGPLVLHRSESPRPDIGSVGRVGLALAFTLVLASETTAAASASIQHASSGRLDKMAAPWPSCWASH